MELKIKTEKLKEMLSKSIKGASNNKLIPLTSLMCLHLENGTFTITTTDATNYLYIKEDNITGDDFYVVVEVDTFSKLIARLTCDEVVLTLKENSLEIIGNGTYNISIPLDDDGSMIKYPDPLASVELSGDGVEVNISTIATILEAIKPALATTLEVPCYTSYYVGDRVVATDTYKIASMNVKIFDEPKLISPEMMNLVSVMTSEKIKITEKDNLLIFTSKDVAIYGTVFEGIGDYPIGAISGLVESDFQSSCKVSKTAILQVLDRLSLFVNEYDRNGINLTFTQSGLQISSKSSNGVELVSYLENNNVSEFSCFIDIDMLITQIKANVGDSILIQYGGDNSAIKMIDGNITHIVALLQEE